MSKLNDFLWHASGMCGEHWHPNALNVTAIVLIVCIASAIAYRRMKQ
tara:strand:+ start:275 stop:415 length:141 start_codon:yes stop_codon:yes gene_type:complete